MKNRYKKNNPLIISPEKNEILNEAYGLFIDTFLEYIKKNNLTEDEIIEFRNELEKAYFIQKSTFLLENKLNLFSNYFSNALLKTVEDESYEYVTNFYYRAKSHLITN